MATVNIRIDINEASPEDPMVLRLLDALSDSAPTQNVAAAKPAPAPAEAKEAKKPAPAKAKKDSPKKAEKPEPEPEEDDSEDAVDEEISGDDGPKTMEDAIAAATAKISDGKQAEVKAALKEVGARRVSELKGDKIATFLEALNNG